MNMPKCEFCGRELAPRFVEILGKKMQVGFMACDCDGAVADRLRRESEAASDEQNEAMERLRRSIIRAGIPERYREAKTERVDLIEKSRNGGLYLWGTVGSGKTHLACALGIEAIKSGRRVRFVKAGTISAALGYSGIDDAIELFRAPELLIIDDLGMDNVSEWSTSRMRIAIDTRYDTGKPTIITSNYARNQLTSLVSGLNADDLRNNRTSENLMAARAITSRICEMTEAFEIAGRDRRLNG